MSSVLSSTADAAGSGRPVIRCDVADHALLEVAGRGLHRRLLGALDLAERPLVDALPALERGELLAPGGEPLGVAGDLLGVDGVRLDPGAGVRPRRRGPARGPSPGRGPRPRAAPGPAAPWRSARAPRARSSSARSRGRPRRAAPAASRPAPCRRARRAGRSAGRSGRRAPPRAASSVLGGGEVRQAERRRAAGRVSASACASSASISERPRSRRSISTSRSWSLDPCRSAGATRRRTARTTPITATTPPTGSAADAEVDDAERVRAANGPPATRSPTTTSSDRDPRDAAARSARGGDLERDLDLAGQGGPQLADLRVERPQPLDDLLEDGQRVRRRVGRRETGRARRRPSTAWR